MFLQFSALKKFVTMVVITNFVLLAGFPLQAAPKYDPLYDKEATIFFKVVNIRANDVLNIRKSPNSRSKKVGKIPVGKHCIAYLNEIAGSTSQKNWVKISYKGVKGWASLDYLSREEMGCGTYYKVVKVRSHLNIRKSPRLYSRKVGKIPAHEDCFIGVDKYVSRFKRRWALVKYRGIRGWVNSHYLTKINVDECDV
jgi:uncharacterized protein YgiM (DUF1202 family)